MTRRLKIDDLTDLAVPSQPALSPDGDRVVYVLRTLDAGEDRNVDQLWTVPTSGGTPRRLTTGNADTSPAWSPDGSRIAFVRDGQVHLLATDGGEPERVTDLPLGVGAPVWSPDGARLAFTAPVDPGSAGPLVADRLDYQADGSGMFGAVRSQVHVVDLASGECRQVTDGTEHAGAPTWSPDGGTIAFARAVGEDSDLRFRIAVHLLAVDDPKALPRVFAFADDVVFGENAVAGMLALFARTGNPVLAVQEVAADEVRKFGILDTTTENGVDVVQRFVEKPGPGETTSRLASLGRYLVTPELVNVLRSTPTGKGGELWLADAFIHLLNAGRQLNAYRLTTGQWHTVGTPEGYVRAASAAMEFESLPSSRT